MTSIGQAYPTLSYIMVDSTDNMTRMYPQALLKQFTDLAVKPNWVQYDINAEFNNEISWYFVNTSDDIKSSQTDFLRNVVHELMHGLGFMTAWSDELYTCLSPLFPDSLNRFITPISLSTINNNKIMSDYNNNQPFWGFVEFPFDKLLNYVDSNTFKPFSDLTRSLNHFANSNTTFRSMVDFANAWYKSDEYTVASQAYTKSVTNLDVLAVVNNEPVLYLETSLNPFSAGSSLCHVSQSNYLNTIEYLMVYTANTGVNLEQLNKMYSGGPFGPKLLKVLTQLGYAVHSNYNMTASRPSLSYWNPSDGLVGTNSNPSPALSVDTSGPACTPTNAATNTANATSSSVSLGHDKSWFLSLTFLFILLLLS
ncbi:uncharacterized protein B0P05DRAFT_577981 [Gilbertella persicaria]|uniref:uncharacterized protein n=1 Tax=Gilbertella persicaria TaxID=101096 RepID=UPI00222090C4|nr:uncharacterized protein B0P05DRAFT_577981 [Gilbertella persicaria]KAI8087696.1 hypothetical protein B0P05DRAFT_577981 [Gilbertella persicaria]